MLGLGCSGSRDGGGGGGGGGVLSVEPQEKKLSCQKINFSNFDQNF